jgi:hypothetical protein
VVCVAVWPPGSRAQDPAQPREVEIPATATTLEGVPTVRIELAQEGTTRRVLSAVEASRDRLTVTIVDGKFYWASRGHRPLQLSSTGDFTYLSSEPGKYIRITRLDDTISYVEHVDMASGRSPGGAS